MHSWLHKNSCNKLSRLAWPPLAVMLLLLTACAAITNKPPQAAIATAHPLATQAGKEVLQAGGNAFDAAVAITAAIGVVEPQSSGIGGGGFWLLHRESDNFEIMVDGREVAPKAAHRDMYLDKQGDVIPKASINGPLAAGIPGVPAAIVHIARRYGKLPLKKSLAPAIRYATEGFEVDRRYHRLAGLRKKALLASAEASRIFLPNNEVPAVGYILKQPDLAKTLTNIAENGYDGFYRGGFAKRLSDGVQKAGGNWTVEDLRDYKIVERKPMTASYKGMRITTAALPSSGGVVLISMLHILENFDTSKMSKVERAHLLIEIMRRAYRDRAEYLGDPDFVDVPVARLTSADYAAQLAKSISPEEATPSSSLKPAAPATGAGNDTTHFSVLDKDGNRVAATLSVNYPFGAGVVIPGFGFLLNDEMDDFSAKPGVPNAYGLVGTDANAIQAGKRPLSSMSPTFLENDRGIAILGTPGGSRIISMVLLGALNFFNGGDAETIVDTPRFHHQYLPDIVMYEDKAFTEKEAQDLILNGHTMKRQMSPYGGGQSVYGNMQAIVWDKKKKQVTAASDKRGAGKAELFK